MDEHEREERQFEQDLASGLITLAEFNKCIQRVQRAYRDDAQEAAREAYERELDRW